MEEIIKTFHLDIKNIIAQFINFGIVLFVLYKFAYKPLLAKMNERSEIIEKGLADAKKSQEQLEEAEQIRERKILEIKKESREILEKSQKMAEKNKEEIIKRAGEESKKVMEETKIQIQVEKEKMLKESRRQIGETVALALERILNEKATNEKDKELIETAINEIKSK